MGYAVWPDGSEALEDVWRERQRQQHEEGWSKDHDDTHKWGVLAGAGSAYAMSAAAMLTTHRNDPVILTPPPFFMFEPAQWKPSDPRRDLVKAAALILAEIEKIDRQLAKVAQP